MLSNWHLPLVDSRDFLCNIFVCRNFKKIENLPSQHNVYYHWYIFLSHIEYFLYILFNEIFYYAVCSFIMAVPVCIQWISIPFKYFKCESVNLIEMKCIITQLSLKTDFLLMSRPLYWVLPRLFDSQIRSPAARCGLFCLARVKYGAIPLSRAGIWCSISLLHGLGY